jgi:ribosomal protein L37AE/L43A
MAVGVDEVANAMYEMVKDYHGKKNLKAMDLTKAMREKFGEDECDKKTCKAAIREIIDSGRCTYSYVGGSYVVLNPEYKEE